MQGGHGNLTPISGDVRLMEELLMYRKLSMSLSNQRFVADSFHPSESIPNDKDVMH